MEESNYFRGQYRERGVSSSFRSRDDRRGNLQRSRNYWSQGDDRDWYHQQPPSETNSHDKVVVNTPSVQDHIDSSHSHHKSRDPRLSRGHFSKPKHIETIHSPPPKHSIDKDISYTTYKGGSPEYYKHNRYADSKMRDSYSLSSTFDDKNIPYSHYDEKNPEYIKCNYYTDPKAPNMRSPSPPYDRTIITSYASNEKHNSRYSHNYSSEHKNADFRSPSPPFDYDKVHFPRRDSSKYRHDSHYISSRNHNRSISPQIHLDVNISYSHHEASHSDYSRNPYKDTDLRKGESNYKSSWSHREKNRKFDEHRSSSSHHDPPRDSKAYYHSADKYSQSLRPHCQTTYNYSNSSSSPTRESQMANKYSSSYASREHQHPIINHGSSRNLVESNTKDHSELNSSHQYAPKSCDRTTSTIPRGQPEKSVADLISKLYSPNDSRLNSRTTQDRLAPSSHNVKASDIDSGITTPVQKVQGTPSHNIQGGDGGITAPLQKTQDHDIKRDLISLIAQDIDIKMDITSASNTHGGIKSRTASPLQDAGCGDEGDITFLAEVPRKDIGSTNKPGSESDVKSSSQGSSSSMSSTTVNQIADIVGNTMQIQDAKVDDSTCNTMTEKAIDFKECEMIDVYKEPALPMKSEDQKEVRCVLKEVKELHHNNVQPRRVTRHSKPICDTDELRSDEPASEIKKARTEVAIKRCNYGDENVTERVTRSKALITDTPITPKLEIKPCVFATPIPSNGIKNSEELIKPEKREDDKKINEFAEVLKQEPEVKRKKMCKTLKFKASINDACTKTVLNSVAIENTLTENKELITKQMLSHQSMTHNNQHTTKQISPHQSFYKKKSSFHQNTRLTRSLQHSKISDKRQTRLRCLRSRQQQASNNSLITKPTRKAVVLKRAIEKLPKSISSLETSGQKATPSIPDKAKPSHQTAYKSIIQPPEVQASSLSAECLFQKAKKSFIGPHVDSNRSSNISKITRSFKLDPKATNRKKKKKNFKGGRYQLYFNRRPRKKKSLSPVVSINPLRKMNSARKSFSQSVNDFQISKSVGFSESDSTASDLITHDSVQPIFNLEDGNDIFLNLKIPSSQPTNGLQTSRKSFVRNNKPQSEIMGDNVQYNSTSWVPIARNEGVAKKSIASEFSSHVAMNSTAKLILGNALTKSASLDLSSVLNNQEKPDCLSQKSVVSHAQTSRKQITRETNYVCSCREKPLKQQSSLPLEDTMCQAVDSIDEKLIGCTNNLSENILARPSSKLEHTEMCQIHLLRLRYHQCCPLCGVFCSQGSFLTCKSMKTNSNTCEMHMFHRKCLAESSCPHCRSSTGIEDVKLSLNSNVSVKRFLSSTSHHSTKKLSKSVTDTVNSSLSSNKSAGKYLAILDDLNITPTKEALRSIVEKRDNRSMKFFQSALKHGDSGRVFHYLRSGIDVNHKFDNDDDNTPLHIAASHGHNTIVKLLLEAGACLDSVNESLSTPLMAAVEKNQLVVVQQFLLLKSSIHWPDNSGMTCFHIACRCGNKKICELIYDTGEIRLDVQDDGGWTPLVWACEHKHLEIVNWLLEKGSNPLIRDKEGNVALHWAAFSGDGRIAQRLLDTACNVDTANNHGDTPLHIAARQNNYECAVLFMKKGANIELKNLEDLTPIMCCEDEKSEILKALQWYRDAKPVDNQLIRKIDNEIFRDLSRGREYCPISVINDVDNSEFTMNFRYVKEVCETTVTTIDRSVSHTKACKCKPMCSRFHCNCIGLSSTCWYDENHRLRQDFRYSDPPVIFECNRMCQCPFSCINRVVQHGIKYPLQVFRNKLKGWGVRTANAIPKGSFVCQYVGELLSPAEVKCRKEDSYIFELDDTDRFCIDSNKYGNVSRFINHSCEPNMVPVKVFTNHRDQRFPHIAFFTTRDVRPKEELSFDYGAHFWKVKCQFFLCACLSPHCRYSIDTIDYTLKKMFGPELIDLEPCCSTSS